MAWWTRKEPSPEERKQEMEKLAKAGDPRAVKAIRAGLKDADKDIRVHAVSCLGLCLVWGLGEFDWLLAALHDPDPDVRSMTAAMAASVDKQRAFEPVAALLNDLNPHVRWGATHALGFNCGPRAIPLMLSALKDEAGNVRREAAYMLGWIGSKEAVQPLTAALEDPEESVRKAAADALKKIGAPGGEGS